MRLLQRLRRLGLARLVLAWFALSLGVAVASPVVQPRSMELVCSAAGSIKLMVLADDGVHEAGAAHFECALCLPGGAPPPALALALPSLQPLGHVLQLVETARIAAATAGPPPARAPPVLA